MMQTDGRRLFWLALSQARRFLLPVCLLLGLVLIGFCPRPAAASPCNPEIVLLSGGLKTDCGDVGWYTNLVAQIKQGLEKIKWLKDAFELINDIFTLLNDFLDKINTAWNKLGVVVSAGQQAQVENKTRLAQEREDNDYKNMSEKNEAKTIADKLDPLVLQALVCNMIILRLVHVAMIPFAEMVSRMVAMGMPLKYMGAGNDGQGAQYDQDDYVTVCGDPTDGTKPALAPRIDGYDYDKCAMPSPINSSGGLEGAHQLATTLDRTNALIFPSLSASTKSSGGTGSSSSVVVYIPTLSEDNGGQARFMAAMDYCYTLAGRKPTPPNHTLATTKQGKHVLAQYNHCAAIRSTFVKQCTDRIGFLTRPDCTNSDFQDLCKASVAACSAAVKAGIMLPPSMDACKFGLSLYEVEYLSHLVCLSGDRASDTALAGKKWPMAMRSSDTCALMMDAWNRQMAIEDHNWLVAARAMLSLDSCWGDYDSAYNSLPKSASNDNPAGQNQSRPVNSLKYKTKQTPVPVKATINPRDGDAHYADELLQPIRLKHASGY